MSDSPDTPRKPSDRFDAIGFFRTLPKPRGVTYKNPETRNRDKAFKWTTIPFVFPHQEDLYDLRRYHPAFQFIYHDVQPRGWVIAAGVNQGKRGYRIKVRYNPELFPTKQDPGPYAPKRTR